MFWADFHIHSTFSDGKLSIPQIIDLYGTHGFGAIAITDHLCEGETVIGKAANYLNRTLTRSTFSLYLAILNSEAERAMRQYGMLVIPGVELSKNAVRSDRSSHILALGIRDYIEADQNVPDLLRQIRVQGGLSIAAHPVDTGKVEKQTRYLWNNREQLRDMIDAWEVAAGRRFFDEVAATDLPKIANSDFHQRGHFESWKNVLTCERSMKSVFGAIRRQEIQFRYFEDSFVIAPSWKEGVGGVS